MNNVNLNNRLWRPLRIFLVYLYFISMNVGVIYSVTFTSFCLVLWVIFFWNPTIFTYPLQLNECYVNMLDNFSDLLGSIVWLGEKSVCRCLVLSERLQVWQEWQHLVSSSLFLWWVHLLHTRNASRQPDLTCDEWKLLLLLW